MEEKGDPDIDVAQAGIEEIKEMVYKGLDREKGTALGIEKKDERVVQKEDCQDQTGRDDKQ